MPSLFLCLLSPFLVQHVLAQRDYNSGAWRSALSGPDTCWTDPTCNRAMDVSHGGDWDYEYPYDSQPAFERAYERGADAVKGDFRVAKDNIGVVMHSSPILAYESFNCYDQYVENMTSEECMQCQMIYTDYYFTDVPNMLAWADGKINVMYCVKKDADIPRAISTLIELNATNRAFLEIGVSALFDIAVQSPGFDQVFFVIEIPNAEEFNRFIAAERSILKRTFLIEFQNEFDWDREQLANCTAAAHDKGLRTFAPTRDSGKTATVEEHLRIWNDNIDVVYTYNLTNAIEARQDVNKRRKIYPP